MKANYITADDGVSIAYHADDPGKPTLVLIPGAVSNLTLEAQSPVFVRFFENLSRFARVLRFDKRGTGLSDPVVEPPSLDRYVDDVASLLDAIGSERATICGTSHGGMVATQFALRHPERSEGLILINAISCDRMNAMSDEARPSLMGHMGAKLEQGYDSFMQWVGECCIAGDAEDMVALVVAFLQATSSPHSWRVALRSCADIDLRPRLGEITGKALVVHATADGLVDISHGRAYAAHIPGARYLELDSDAHLPLLDRRAAPIVVSAIEELMTGTVRHTADRVVTTVLFTDIVDSTGQQTAVGDAEWRSLHERFEAETQRRVEQFEGRVVQFTGDGVMAAFTSPSQALRAGRTLVEDAARLGFAIRAGVHSGEAYEVDAQLFGTCVHVAARVSAEADAGDILTTQVVAGLVEGSGFEFVDAGAPELRGIGARQLLRLVT